MNALIKVIIGVMMCCMGTMGYDEHKIQLEYNLN